MGRGTSEKTRDGMLWEERYLMISGRTCSFAGFERGKDVGREEENMYCRLYCSKVKRSPGRNL
jgi:hypothetical protein